MKVELPTNMEDVEAGGDFELLPPGTYALAVDNIEIKTSQSSQKPYMNMTYKVVDDPDYAGRKLFDIISLAESALFRLKQFSLATGVDIATSFDTEDFLNAEFSSVVDIEKGTLKPGTDDEFYPDKNKVKSYVFEK